MLKVKFNGLTGFNDVQIEKLRIAAELLEKAVNSDVFESCVSTHGFWLVSKVRVGFLKWKTVRNWYWGFHYTSDTSQAVWRRICSGAEVLSPECDAEIDIDLNLVAGKRGVIGYTYPNTPKTWIARWFIDSAEPWEIAMNLMHEWAHKQGYGHEFRDNPHRRFSVPYALGYIVRDIARAEWERRQRT